MYLFVTSILTSFCRTKCTRSTTKGNIKVSFIIKHTHTHTHAHGQYIAYAKTHDPDKKAKSKVDQIQS